MSCAVGCVRLSRIVLVCCVLFVVCSMKYVYVVCVWQPFATVVCVRVRLSAIALVRSIPFTVCFFSEPSEFLLSGESVLSVLLTLLGIPLLIPVDVSADY